MSKPNPELAELLATSITLRDLFAAFALSGVVGSDLVLNEDSPEDDFAEHVALCYKYADALLALREQRGKQKFVNAGLAPNGG